MSRVETRDYEAVERFLRRDAVTNAYPLGYLDELYAAETKVFGSWDGGQLETVVLAYFGLTRPALFTVGDAGGVRPLLRDCAAELPEQATGHIPRGHLGAVRTAYEPMGELAMMSRMGLMRDDFVDDVAADDTVVRLSHTDTGAIMALYAHWPDNFFEPFQLESGLYFGVRADDGSLASIAGIHNVSERFDIAAIGNLVTHPAHRGRGLARRCTARLLRETFRRVRLVTLDVQHGNEPAIRTYRHFGFDHYDDYHEGALERR